MNNSKKSLLASYLSCEYKEASVIEMIAHHIRVGITQVQIIHSIDLHPFSVAIYNFKLFLR